jgi:hypothetical protein
MLGEAGDLEAGQECARTARQDLLERPLHVPGSLGVGENDRNRVAQVVDLLKRVRNFRATKVAQI